MLTKLTKSVVVMCLMDSAVVRAERMETGEDSPLMQTVRRMHSGEDSPLMQTVHASQVLQEKQEEFHAMAAMEASPPALAGLLLVPWTEVALAPAQAKQALDSALADPRVQKIVAPVKEQVALLDEKYGLSVKAEVRRVAAAATEEVQEQMEAHKEAIDQAKTVSGVVSTTVQQELQKQLDTHEADIDKLKAKVATASATANQELQKQMTVHQADIDQLTAAATTASAKVKASSAAVYETVDQEMQKQIDDHQVVIKQLKATAATASGPAKQELQQQMVAHQADIDQLKEAADAASMKVKNTPAWAFATVAQELQEQIEEHQDAIDKLQEAAATASARAEIVSAAVSARVKQELQKQIDAHEGGIEQLKKAAGMASAELQQEIDKVKTRAKEEAFNMAYEAASGNAKEEIEAIIAVVRKLLAELGEEDRKLLEELLAQLAPDHAEQLHRLLLAPRDQIADAVLPHGSDDLFAADTATQAKAALRLLAMAEANAWWMQGGLFDEHPGELKQMPQLNEVHVFESLVRQAKADPELRKGLRKVLVTVRKEGLRSEANKPGVTETIGDIRALTKKLMEDGSKDPKLFEQHWHTVSPKTKMVLAEVNDVIRSVVAEHSVLADAISEAQGTTQTVALAASVESKAEVLSAADAKVVLKLLAVAESFWGGEGSEEEDVDSKLQEWYGGYQAQEKELGDLIKQQEAQTKALDEWYATQKRQANEVEQYLEARKETTTTEAAPAEEGDASAWWR